MSKAGIRRRVRRTDNRKWREEINARTTLSLYREYKYEVKDDNIYDNRESSRLLYWARSNSLRLNDWNRHQKGNVSCQMCGEEKEDLLHFIIKCKGIEDKRNEEIIEKKKGESDRETMGNLLFRSKGEDLEELKKMLKKMWDARKARIS